MVYFGPIPFFKDEIPNFPAQKHRNTSPSSFFTQCSASAEDTNGGFSLCRATLCQVIVPCRQAEPDSGRWRSLNPRNYGEQYAGKYGQHGEDMEKIYGENMGNIWGKYGENMGKSWKPSWFHTFWHLLGGCYTQYPPVSSLKITKHGGLNGTIIELIISWWILKSSCRDHPVLEFNLSSIKLVTSLERKKVIHLLVSSFHP